MISSYYQFYPHDSRILSITQLQKTVFQYFKMCLNIYNLAIKYIKFVNLRP